MQLINLHDYMHIQLVEEDLKFPPLSIQLRIPVANNR